MPTASLKGHDADMLRESVQGPCRIHRISGNLLHRAVLEAMATVEGDRRELERESHVR